MIVCLVFVPLWFIVDADRICFTPREPSTIWLNMLRDARIDTAMAAKVAAFTGLSVDYVKESKLHISATRFRKELLRGDEREVLGTPCRPLVDRRFRDRGDRLGRDVGQRRFG